MSESDAVDAIIRDIKNRRGLRQQWEQIDPDIRESIRDDWVAILENEREL